MTRINDNYRINFDSLTEATDEFAAFKRNAATRQVANTDLSVAVIDETMTPVAGISDEAWQDTLANSRILLCHADGTVIPVRSCAVPHVLDRAGYSCKVADKMRTAYPEEFAVTTTRNLAIMGGKSTVYVSFEKLACLGSGKFAPMEMADLTDILIDSFNQRLGSSNIAFMSGGLTHEYGSLRVEVDDTSIISAYEKELMFHECDEREMKPVITLSTSNTKNSGATLTASLVNKKGNVRIPCGQLSSVVHKGDPTKRLDAFRSNCDAAFARFRNVTERLNAMLAIELDYPLSVLKGAAKKIGFNRPSIMPYFIRAYNLYVSAWGPAATNAHEIYWGLAETIRFMEEDNAPLGLVLQAEELLMECLSPRFAWGSYDTKDVQFAVAASA